MVRGSYYVLRVTDLIEGRGDNKIRLAHGERILVVSPAHLEMATSKWSI